MRGGDCGDVTIEGNNWHTAKLGDVIDLFDSRRVPLNSRERQERQGDYPYYGAQGIIDHIDGFLFDGSYILVAEDGENLNSKKLPLALFADGKFFTVQILAIFCDENVATVENVTVNVVDDSLRAVVRILAGAFLTLAAVERHAL